MHGFLAQTVAMLVASAVIAYICHRLKILPIVGFLLAGVVIGPYALALVEDAALIDQVAEIGIVLLLFTIGLEFSLERLWRIKRAIFIGGGLQLGLTIAVVAGVLALIHIDWRIGLYTGALVALSSTALVLKVLGDRNEVNSAKGQLTLGILCCDSSKNKHATKHYHASSHPIMRSYQPGEMWGWCYPDERTL